MAHYAKIRTDGGSFVDLDYAKVAGEASAASVYCDETYDQRVMVMVTGPTHRCMTVASDTSFGLYDNEARSWIWQQKMPIYPVGAIYMSTSSTSPSSTYGGTWERIQGRFLLGASSSYASMSTGGEKNHQLSIQEIPSHTHTQHLAWGSGGNKSGVQFYNNATPATDDSWDGNGVYIGYTGQSHAHNNMPPYYVVYIWRRTA